jgi:hypothetical protein
VTIDFFSTAPRRSARPIAIAGPFVGIAETQKSIDHCRRTAHAEIAGYCIKGTILGAGAAFKACIQVDNQGFFSLYCKHVSRTNFKAHAAPGAFVLVYGNGSNIM